METEIVQFPLKGVWVAYHTPADKVPTHGTDVLGMRYAYDILQIQWKEKGLKFYHPSKVKYWLKGVTLSECLGYEETIYSPFNGKVIEAYSEYSERDRLHPIIDFIFGHGKSIMFMFSKKPEKNIDLLPIIGNYIIMKMKSKDIYSLFAHLKQGSLNVVAGDEVRTGQPIAKVGHSGNSTAPHLHFQLMNQANLLTSAGIQCKFIEYEAWDGKDWEVVKNGTPEKLRPINFS